MARRFYLPSSGAAAVSPAFGAWGKTSDADRIALSRNRSGTAMADKTSSENSAVGGFIFLTRQYVSDPLIAQTISGNVKAQIRVSEDVTSADFLRAIIIRVCSNDGSTFRGTLVENATGGTEYATSLTNRKVPESLGLTSVDAQAGDRLVIEFGTHAPTAGVGTFTATHRFGDTGSTDLPEDETTTSDDVPWIEFSGDIFFQSENLASTSDGLSTAEAILALRRTLSVSPEALSTAEAILALRRTLSVSPEAFSTADAVLELRRTLAGTSDGLSTADAELLRQVTMPATSDGVTAIDVTLTRLVDLLGTADGVAVVDAVLSRHTFLPGATSDGLSSADAILARLITLAGTADGLSTADGLLALRRTLAGTADGLSTVDAILVSLISLTGTADGLSTADGLLALLRTLAGTSDGSSTADGDMSRQRGLLGFSDGSTRVRATLRRLGEGDVSLFDYGGGGPIVTAATGQTTLIRPTQGAWDILVYRDYPVSF